MKQKNNLKHNNKAITLIALVITIIVMLILVGVTINMAVNGGLFGYAGNAVNDTELAKQNEQKLAEGSIEVDGKKYDTLDDYINGVESGSEKFSAIYTSTDKNFKDPDGKSAVIPKGFAVGTSEGINKVSKGLVIQDEQGNQFVWIPVEYEGSTKVDGFYPEFLAKFYTSAWNNNARWENALDSKYKEPHTTAEQWELDEYNNMLLSVQENKGFYIGRFEAGIPITENPRMTDEANLGTNTMVIKRDCYPYNYVGWGASLTNYTGDIINTVGSTSYNLGKGAVYLSKNMYDPTKYPNKYGAVSTLCYGVQWDAMLDFIKDEKNVTDSINWGHFMTYHGEIDRQTVKFCDLSGLNPTWQSVSETENKKIELPGMSYTLLTTGASDDFKAKNIYDVAGNYDEWSMETYNDTTIVIRGASIGISEGAEEASCRYIYTLMPTTYVTFGTSFRVTLYINE